MDLNKTLEKINKDREKTECCFVFALWDDPEQYESYIDLNSGKDKTLKNEDSIFYFMLGKALYKNGYRNFDNISLEEYLSKKPKVKEMYDNYGGYQTIKDLTSLISKNNIEAYFDKIVKMNSLDMLANKYEEIFNDVERFDDVTSEDVYETFELINNSVSISAAHNEDILDLTLDEKFITDLKNGNNMGFNYGKFCPLLNYITLGAMPGSLYLIGGHSGTGKSSFAFESIIMSLHYNNIPTAIISNEMNIDTYKVLLLSHILTQDLNYWKLTRKQIRMGKWDEEQSEMIDKAIKISQEKYSDIKFVKLFDNNINKITKYIKKLKTQHSTSVIFYDTFKSDDNSDINNLWQSLILDSRKLHKTIDKLGVCLITTYQLALHTTNQRYLDAGCLSNSKGIKEVYETMVYFRPVWADEMPGEKYDIKPYRISKTNNKIKEEIKMDPDKKYLLCFLDKTRADEDKQILLYEWNARFNTWKELGFARVINDHRGN